MMYGDGGWMWGHSWGWGGWLAMSIVMVLFWAAIIIAIVVAIRYLSTPHRPTASTPAAGQARSAAENTLAERFARGEIDEEEYRRRVSILREHS